MTILGEWHGAGQAMKQKKNPEMNVNALRLREQDVAKANLSVSDEVRGKETKGKKRVQPHARPCCFLRDTGPHATFSSSMSSAWGTEAKFVNALEH